MSSNRNDLEDGLYYYNQLELPYPIKVGKEWTVPGEMEGTAHLKIISTNETITTPAGTFMKRRDGSNVSKSYKN